MKAIKIHLLLAFLVFVVYQTFPANVLANDEWLKVRSENFQLTGDANEKDIQQTAFKLERFREIFTSSFAGQTFNSPIPTNVIVFKTEKEFRLYKTPNSKVEAKADLSGFFQGGEDLNYIVLSVENTKTDSFRRIYHQYAHFLINNNPGKAKIPPWFYEGLAAYYEDLQLEDDDKIIVGSGRPDYLDLLKTNDFIPFEKFFDIEYYTLHQQQTEGEGLFYAQAWALTHYLINTKPPEQLSRFIKLISAGAAPKESFIKAFQTDLTTLETELRKYTEQKSFQAFPKTFDKKTFIHENSATVSEAEAESYLGDLLYHTGRFEEAESHLKRALNLAPDLNSANSTLGLIRAKQFQYEEAQNLAEKAIAGSRAQNYQNYFRYAYILSRRGMTDYGFVSGYNFADADKMREALKKSIALDPNFAESYNLYALISFVRNDELDEALEFIGKALQIAPGNQQYILRLSELNLRKERFTEARKNALDVFQNASESGLRLYSQNTVQRIDSTEAQLMQIRRNKGKYINDDTVTDLPMSEEEIARRRSKAMLDSIRTGLRKPIDGQKRIAGNLIRVECESKQVNFIVKMENEIIKLQAGSLEGINLITYNQNMYGAEINCGEIKRENNAVIIYRVADPVKTNILGEIISIEFVPKEFKLIASYQE